MSVEIANESGVDVDEAALASVARHTLERLGVNPLAELSVIVVDQGTMAALHERWMGEPGATDVLAFPMDELDTARGPDEPEPGPALLGDVVLCPEYARAGARAAGQSLAAELELLTTHGVLHLLGYDHAEPEEEREMFGLQASLLESWRAVQRGNAPSR
jgi:probable rRNA maturation factor